MDFVLAPVRVDGVLAYVPPHKQPSIVLYCRMELTAKTKGRHLTVPKQSSEKKNRQKQQQEEEEEQQRKPKSE